MHISVCCRGYDLVYSYFNKVLLSSVEYFLDLSIYIYLYTQQYKIMYRSIYVKGVLGHLLFLTINDTNNLFRAFKLSSQLIPVSLNVFYYVLLTNALLFPRRSAKRDPFISVLHIHLVLFLLPHLGPGIYKFLLKYRNTLL